MPIARLTIATAALLLSAGCATQPGRDAVAAFVPKPGAKPESCVPLTAIRETQVRDDRTIDFVMRNGRILRNTLPYSCPQLGFERRFSYATSLSQLCSVDIITVLFNNPPIRGASCGLGQFQEVIPAK